MWMIMIFQQKLIKFTSPLLHLLKVTNSQSNEYNNIIIRAIKIKNEKYKQQVTVCNIHPWSKQASIFFVWA
jgi:hypothetical protein